MGDTSNGDMTSRTVCGKMDRVSEITRLLRPDDGATPDLEAVFDRLYPELKQIARARLRNLPHGATLTPTVVVAEAYVKLVQAESLEIRNQRHFYACAARAMRHLIVDNVRHATRDKRGGGLESITLHEDLVALIGPSIRLLDLDRALDELNRLSQKQRELVELKFFAGLTTSEIARILEMSERTVARQWNSAKAFLHAHLAN